LQAPDVGLFDGFQGSIGHSRRDRQERVGVVCASTRSGLLFEGLGLLP
jgi:hypothetical protein